MRLANTLGPLIFAATACILLSFSTAGQSTESGNKRVIISNIQLLKFPELKTDGRRWDNYWGGYLPDVYFVIKNVTAKKIMYSNPSRRIENLKLHGTAEFSPGFVINDLTQTYAICLYDYDSITENDLIGSIVLSPAIDVGQNTLTWEKDGVLLRIKLEWKD
ncbi:MAG: hypothetical protein KDD12_01295 [Lewinella sp.]|nr:hypothetical protein [Lewinella sp.]